VSRPTWMVQVIKTAFPGRYLAARATRIPIIGSALERWLFEGDSMIYLPQDQVFEINQTIDIAGEMVLPSAVVEHFIESASTHWIMNTCICREASRCEDYPIDLGCLFLGEAAAGINPELGRPVTKKEALTHVRRCREAGLVHLVGRNKLDTVWLGVGPGDRLLTICNCCPCCCLWRILPQIADQIGTKITALPGVAVRVTDRCAGCETCTHGICFVNAIHTIDGRATIDDACRACGRCVEVCPQGAIEFVITDPQFVKQAIDRIAPVVDVS
jgi:ferredoxin